jgi:hypothetical protein
MDDFSAGAMGFVARRGNFNGLTMAPHAIAP